MLNLPASLFTKVGSFEIMRTNLSKLPVTILPENSILDVATGNDVNTLGTFNPNAAGQSTFSLSADVTKTSWAIPLAKVSLGAYLDAAGLNGIDVYQADTTGLLTVDFLNAGAKTMTLTYDITGAASGKHTITLARVAATSQDLYVDGALVDSDTDATDVIGEPASAVVGTNIASISKERLCKITTTTNHGLSTGDSVILTGIVGSQTMNRRKNKGMVSLNGIKFSITKTSNSAFTINVDSTQFDTYTATSGSVNYAAPQTISFLTGTTNKLITLNKLDANDAEILYQLGQNNLVVRDENGAIKTVTLV
jgi:hypothetical protein